MSGETVTMSSSDNITIVIYNGNEDHCSYEKWERRLKCGLQLKGVSYTLKDDFKCPAMADTKGGSIQKRYHDNVATDDVGNDLIEDVELAREMKRFWTENSS